MNKLSLLIAALLLSSCKYYEVYHTASSGSDVKERNNHYVYDNGTVRIEYDFWARQGLMSYTVSNVSKNPVYIDWKKSNFIQGKQKKDYYVDGSTSTYESVGSAHVAITKGTEVKEERVTFLPPGAFIERRFYRLIRGAMTINHNRFNDTLLDKKKMKVAYFSNEDKTLIFRNFITYSATEDFKEEAYIDNQFYVDRVLLAKGASSGSQINAKPMDYPSGGPTSFYLNDLWKKEAVN